MQVGGLTILIDCGPEFRIQARHSAITTLNCLLVTHCHYDHVFGIDDIRGFGLVPLFMSPEWAADLRHRFPYLFGGPVLQEGGGVASLELHPVTGPFAVAGVRITPIPLIHKNVRSIGYRSGNFAYLTDCNRIPDASYGLLAGVELLVINASNRRRSDVHCSFHTAMDEIEQICPKKAWFTHIGHSCSHVEVERAIEEELSQRPGLAGVEVRAGFDGLVIEGILPTMP